MANIIIASGSVIVENEAFLLIQEGDADFWKFCGGKVEDFDLDLWDTARREAQEEMGFEIEIINPEAYVMHTQKETASGNADVLLVHWLARRIGEIIPGDIREWRFFTLQELASEKLAPNIMPTLRHFGFC